LLESVLAAEGRSLSIEGVGISLTGDLTVAKVTVRDGNDAWLEIEQLSLVWRRCPCSPSSSTSPRSLPAGFT